MDNLKLYRCCVRAIAPLLRLYLKIRIRLGKEDAGRIFERFGVASIRRPAKTNMIWIHAASVGEAQSVFSMIDKILLAREDVAVLLTTGTKTSAQLVQAKLHSRFLHQYVPLDHPEWVSNFLRYWQPNLAIWVESELWPNLIVMTAESGIPLMLLNARMSDRSFANWQKNPAFIRRMLECFAHVMAQNQVYARYFQFLGARSVEVSGNLKLAALPLPYDADEYLVLRGQIGSRPIWLCASTHDGEEKSAIAIHKLLRRDFPDLLTIIAPRHPHRSGKIQSELAAAQIDFSTRSRKDPITTDNEIYLADSIGELGLFFALSKIVFMGGSFKSKGGHNLLEPARYECAILYGPEMQNFADLDRAMRDNQAAIVVRNDLELHSFAHRLLMDDAMAKNLGARAKQIATGQDQILDLVLSRIYSVMGG